MANETVANKLYADLAASHVEIIDNSWRHEGHEAMRGRPRTAEGTHLHVVVVTKLFDGVSLLDRHRMVHTALRDAFQSHLHALELKTYTPEEWEAQKV